MIETKQMSNNSHTTVWIRTTFNAIHYWPDAPDTVMGRFLRNPHRHCFHVELHKGVEHDNRDIEFLELQRNVRMYCREQIGGPSFLSPTNKSCEMIAQELLDKFDADMVLVSEDGENGAVVYRRPYPKKTAAVSEETKDLPALQVKIRCFGGTEAEGPQRGKGPVLFVPGCVTPDELKRAWDAWMNCPTSGRPRSSYFVYPINHIYLGAGNLPYPIIDTIKTARKLLPPATGLLGSTIHGITVEVDSCLRLDGFVKEILEFGGIIVSRDPKDAQRDDLPDYIKTVTDTEIIWKTPSAFGQYVTRYVTRLDDPLFTLDFNFPY